MRALWAQQHDDHVRAKPTMAMKVREQVGERALEAPRPHRASARRSAKRVAKTVNATVAMTTMT